MMGATGINLRPLATSMHPFERAIYDISRLFATSDALADRVA
jgi:hypothetical protein